MAQSITLAQAGRDEREPYGLGLLAEEMGEAIQVIGKWLRFGRDHVNRTGEWPALQLSIEVGDVLAAIAYAELAGILDARVLRDRRQQKLAKLLDPASRDDQGCRLAPDVGVHAATDEVDRLRAYIAEQIQHVENRIADGKEAGATIWRIALEDVARENRAVLQGQG